MQVWIDQDCCTGAGVCVDRCPDLFVVLEDGLGYVYDDGGVFSEPGRARPVPARHEDAGYKQRQGVVGRLHRARQPCRGAGRAAHVVWQEGAA